MLPSTAALPLPSTDAEYVTSSPSTSLADRVKTKSVSSATVCASIASTTGASLTALTVNAKLLEPERSPSLADTVTVREPLKS